MSGISFDRYQGTRGPLIRWVSFRKEHFQSTFRAGSLGRAIKTMTILYVYTSPNRRTLHALYCCDKSTLLHQNSDSFRAQVSGNNCAEGPIGPPTSSLFSKPNTIAFGSSRA